MNLKRFLKKYFQFIKKNEMLFNFYKQTFHKKYLLIEKETFEILKSFESMSDIELKNIQDKRLFGILNYAYQNTKYYKNLFDEHNEKQFDSSSSCFIFCNIIV